MHDVSQRIFDDCFFFFFKLFKISGFYSSERGQETLLSTDGLAGTSALMSECV